MPHLLPMEKNKEYKILLFDVDDTLLDFTKAESLSFFETMEHFNINANEQMHSEYSRINRECWGLLEKGRISKNQLLVRRFELFANLFKIETEPSEINGFYLKKLSEKAILFPDSLDVCRTLSLSRDLYMITNSVAEVHKNRMENCPLNRFFKGSFISEEVGYPKPGIRFFEAVAQKINNFDKTRALVIGDSPTSDLAGANAYGIDCCFVNRRGVPLPENITAKYTVSTLYELCGILQ